MSAGTNLPGPLRVDGQDPFKVGLPHIAGKWWYVNGGSGTGSPITGSGANGLVGDSWGQAFLTMAKVFEHPDFHSNDGIAWKGNIREQLVSPAGVFDVTMVGASTVTRHADAHGADVSWGGYSSARWNAPASPTASTALLRVQQQGWRIMNGLFTGDENDSVGCIQFFRDGGSGDDERDGSHGQVIGCRFASGLYGIQDSGGCARVKVYGNEFHQFTESDNDAIVSVLGAGIGTMFGWEIIGNRFFANYSDIDIAATGAIIENNHFMLNSLGTTNTIAIDLTGGAEELVAKNYMYCASDEASVVNARFVASSTPSWGPNYYTDVEEYGEPAE